MERLKEIPLNEGTALFLNLRDSDMDKIFFRELLHRTADILKVKDDPVRILADFSGIKYTHKYFDIARDFISQNKQSIRAAAFNGVNLEQEIDPEIVKKASDLHILFFQDMNEAKNWLSTK